MISLLCPTRGRPANMNRLWQSVKDTASNLKDIELIFYIDDDDLDSQQTAKGMGVSRIVGKRIVLSEMWNKCYEISKGDILMHCGDDIIFRTVGWDKMVEDEFKKVNDKILFVYGKDGYSPDSFGTHGFISRNWVEVVGYFVPPYFSSDMNDTWLNDVADTIGRKKFLPELYTEHMHPINGKGEWDQTHLERLERHQTDNVTELYIGKSLERHQDADKLRKFIEFTDSY